MKIAHCISIGYISLHLALQRSYQLIKHFTYSHPCYFLILSFEKKKSQNLFPYAYFFLRSKKNKNQENRDVYNNVHTHVFSLL